MKPRQLGRMKAVIRILLHYGWAHNGRVERRYIVPPRGSGNGGEGAQGVTIFPRLRYWLPGTAHRALIGTRTISIYTTTPSGVFGMENFSEEHLDQIRARLEQIKHRAR